MNKYKLLLIGGLALLLVVLFVGVRLSKLAADESTHDLVYSHSLLDIEPVGKIYFLNDLVGVSPRQNELPAAFLLNHSAVPYVVRSSAIAPATLEPGDDWGISQDPYIGGWGAGTERVISDARLNLTYINTMLSGEFAGGKSGNSAGAGESIEIDIPWKDVSYFSQGDIVIEPLEVDEKVSRYRVHLNGPGSFWMEPQPPPTDGFPIQFRLKGITRGELSIGQKSLAPPTTEFTLATRDMHSIAFGELDGASGVVASIVRGGVRGEIETVVPDARDIFIDFSNHREIIDDSPAMPKFACRGRQSAWVDIDNDNDLDLYIVCGGHGEASAESSNQLYISQGGKLREDAASFGLDIKGGGAFLFVDWDGDLDLDLWWADDNGDLVYYQNSKAFYRSLEHFESVWSGGHRPPQLMLKDFQGDMDPDLYLLHPRGSILIENGDTGNQLASAADYGLPEKARAAVWADVNLDGYTDLLTVSMGVYLGGDSVHYSKLGSEVKGARYLRDARLVSFAGPNGRYFLSASSRCLPGRLCKLRKQALLQWRYWFPDSLDVLLEKGRLEPKDWFIHVIKRKAPAATSREVTFFLQGPALNPSSTGAKLDLAWQAHEERHWVGESETSLFSQANFEIYASVPKGIAITGLATWQDGCTLRFTASALVEKVSVKRPEECDKRPRGNAIANALRSSATVD